MYSHKLYCLIFSCLIVLITNSQSFVHPGGLHKKSDLERMKYMVQLNVQPWAGGYAKLQADSKSNYNYTVQGDTSITVVTRDAPYTNSAKLYSDAKAAYYNALMYNINGDARHAQKSIEIFKAWSNLKEVTGGGTESLNGGLLGYMLIEAAEIIQSTYSAWNTADKQKFKNMLVYPGYSNTAIPATLSDTNGTFYWRIFMGDPGRHGNQDIAGMRTMLLMGIFLDNRIMYDRALRYVKGLPHRLDDFSYTAGPSSPSSLNFTTSWFDDYDYVRQSTIADFGYNGTINNYILSNGQCQESSRDQGHSNLGIAMINDVCEMAWTQGDDLYSFSNNKLLKGLSYLCKYNVSYVRSYSDQTTPWEPTTTNGEYVAFWDRTGRWYSKKINPWNATDSSRLTRGYNSTMNPNWEIALAHYGVRFAMPSDSLKWIQRAKQVYNDSLGYEGSASLNLNNADLPGFGTLTFCRPIGCAGDPISGFSSSKPVFKIPVIPTTIKAENFDYFPGIPQNRSCYDLTLTNIVGKYRTDAGVDIDTSSEGGYKISNIENGEWITYTIHVPVASNYAIKVRYAAVASGGKIKFSFGGIDKTSEVELPYGLPNSTSNTDWKDFIIASPVALSPGVQSMKVSFSGVSNAFEINNINIVSASSLSVNLTKFNVSVIGQNTALLELETEAENNNDFFLIEKSNNGLAYYSLKKIIAKNIASVYTVVDDKLFEGANYYRLLQVDKDGKLSVLGIRKLENKTIKKIKIQPNPLLGNSLTISGLNDVVVSVSVFSVDGKNIFQQTRKPNSNDILNISFITKPNSGLYVVRVNNIESFPLIIEK